MNHMVYAASTAETEEETETTSEEAIIPLDEDETMEIPSKGPYFIPLRAVVVPLIKHGQLISNIGVVIELEFAKRKDVMLYRERKPLLRDAFLMDLKRVTRRIENNEPLNVDMLKVLFMRSCNRILGEGKVLQILIKDEYKKQLAPL